MVAIRHGPIGLLRDPQDLHQLATLAASTWDLGAQAAHGARDHDHDLTSLAAKCEPDVTAQLAWLRMRMKAEAP